MKLRKIAIVVPAHNEEKVIGKTLKSLLKLVKPRDIFVVSDGSVDATAEISRKYTSNVLELNSNMGKATAMNMLIKEFKLAKKYQYLMPIDADTIVTKSFLRIMLPVLENDKRKKIACAVGRVVGRSHNWVTFYRIWEYEISQTVHKQAQAIENAIIVCPGCSTIYRASIFDKVELPGGTLTEDMDFTFLIHRMKLGKIAFVGEAKVVTQDPDNLRDFLRQISRWYTGFWQCLLKHDIPWGGQSIDFEVALLASEGIFNGLAVMMLLALLPIVFVRNPTILLIPFMVDLLLFMIPTLLLVGWRYHNWKIFFYLPQFYALRLISSLIFLKSFFSVVLAKDLQMGWSKATRYAIS